MSPAAAPTTRRHRLLRLAGAVLLVVAAAIAAGEWWGWPFLAGPLQNFLSGRLDRQVRFSANDNLHGSTPFAVRFVGGLRLQSAQLEIGAPQWSTAPHFVRGRDVALHMRYIDMWRLYRGQQLRIHKLQAAELDARLERRSDGLASWQFGTAPKPAAAQPARVPLFGYLQVAAGRLRYNDVRSDIDLQAQWSLTSFAGPPQERLVVPQPEATALRPVPTYAGRSGAAGLSPLGGPGEARVGGNLAAGTSPLAGVPVASASAASAAGAAPVEGSNTLRLTGGGHYRQQVFKIELASAGALPWEGGETMAVPVTVVLNATVGRAELSFNGSATDALQLAGLRGRFMLKGPSLAAAGEPLAVTLPTTSAFRLDGMLARQQDNWHVVVEDATVGSSRLNGAFTYTANLAVPTLAGRLGGSRLMLADLGPPVGVAPPGPGTAAKPAAAGPIMPTAAKGRVIPDRRFDLPALRAMDANVLIDIREVDLNTRILEPLRPLHAHLRLRGGVLTLSDLQARTAHGNLRGNLRLDGRGAQAVWNADLGWDGVRLERWIRQSRAAGSPPYISGQLDGRATLEGRGRSTAEILASLRGNTRTELADGSVSHLLVEAAGLDLAQGLGLLIKGDDALRLRCAVADLEVREGIFRPRVMVLDTTDSTVWVDGALSLATERLDLRAVVEPKDFSPLTLRSPLHVRGSFGAPEVSLEKGPVGVKLAAAILLALVNPLAAVLPLIDRGDPEAARRAAAGCQSLLVRMSARPAAARAVR